MSACLLPDRAILAVDGAEAEAFLHRLVTNSVIDLTPGQARYAALLSPQGKLLFDFLIYRQAQGFWLDVAKAQAEELARKLTMFRLRAKVAIALVPELAVAARWGDEQAPLPATVKIFADPRHEALGDRLIGPLADLGDLSRDDDLYERHRVTLGIPKGGADFAYGDTFVHDANLDLLHGVDFQKGCYVGQEVVSRVHHRHSARKRIARLVFAGDPPAEGSPLTAGPIEIGTVRSGFSDQALGQVRTDRLIEATSANVAVCVGDRRIEVILPTTAGP
jgi:folate-binding protein YgfZ